MDENIKLFCRINDDGDETFWCLSEAPECEHCRELEPYDIIYYDGMTFWCLSCANANSHLNELSDDQFRQLLTEENKAKIKYFQGRINAITKNDIEETIYFWRR